MKKYFCIVAVLLIVFLMASCQRNTGLSGANAEEDTLLSSSRPTSEKVESTRDTSLTENTTMNTFTDKEPTDPMLTESLSPENSETTPAMSTPTESYEISKTPFAVWDESTWQEGSPITPQPGDTTVTWDISVANKYPADEDCSPEELLKKWMEVEGVTVAELEARGCEQLVLVAARETDGIETYTNCYQKQEDGIWEPVEELTWMEGWTGSNGIMHDRRRNTNTSPAGLWSLGAAFGNAEMPYGLKMPWRDVTPNSDWVCDEDSIYFNTWQERDDPSLYEEWSDDVEHLENYTSSYAYACVIRYNTPPYMIPNRGCAIFFHCSKGATGGCIGLPEQNMIETLLWMDPRLNPHILITGYQKA